MLFCRTVNNVSCLNNDNIYKLLQREHMTLLGYSEFEIYFTLIAY